MTKSTFLYVLQRRSDGTFYRPNSYKKWVTDIHKAKLYTQAGHPRLAMSEYVPYSRYKHLEPREREKAMAAERRRLFDEQYIIGSVGVNFG